MSYPVVCPACAQKLKAAPELAGKRVSCPACKTPFVIQAPPAAAGTTTAATAAAPAPAAEKAAQPPGSSSPTATKPARITPIVCPQCAKQLKAPAELAGKSVRCPECKTAFKIPGRPPALSKAASQATPIASPAVPPIVPAC